VVELIRGTIWEYAGMIQWHCLLHRCAGPGVVSPPGRLEAPEGKPSWQLAGAGCGFSITGLKARRGRDVKESRKAEGMDSQRAECEPQRQFSAVMLLMVRAVRGLGK
jgi:hypothetical protein